MTAKAEILCASYPGDVDPKQERACIAALRAEVKGKKVIRLEDVKAAGVECRFKGKFRILRAFNPGPYGIAGEWGQWINRIDLAFKQPQS